LLIFSSRRRYTRFSRDWSSDVCSSDLGSTGMVTAKAEIIEVRAPPRVVPPENGVFGAPCPAARRRMHKPFSLRQSALKPPGSGKIGRASCRERKETLGVVYGVTNNGMS